MAIVTLCHNLGKKWNMYKRKSYDILKFKRFTDMKTEARFSGIS